MSRAEIDAQIAAIRRVHDRGRHLGLCEDDAYRLAFAAWHGDTVLTGTEPCAACKPLVARLARPATTTTAWRTWFPEPVPTATATRRPSFEDVLRGRGGRQVTWKGR